MKPIGGSYFRWRKREGQVPKFGPYLVIRWHRQDWDWATGEDLDYIDCSRTVTLGLWLTEKFHLKFMYGTHWKESL